MSNVKNMYNQMAATQWDIPSMAGGIEFNRALNRLFTTQSLSSSDKAKTLVAEWNPYTAIMNSVNLNDIQRERALKEQTIGAKKAVPVTTNPEGVGSSTQNVLKGGTQKPSIKDPMPNNIGQSGYTEDPDEFITPNTKKAWGKLGGNRTPAEQQEYNRVHNSIDTEGAKDAGYDKPVNERGGFSQVFKSQGMQNALNAVGAIGGSVAAISNKAEMPESDIAVREGIRGTIGKFGPWGAAIAAASGVVDAVGDLTGNNLSNIDSEAAKRAGVSGGAAFNKIMNMIPGNSMVFGVMGQNTMASNMSDQTRQLGGAFSGSVGDIQAAQELGDKRMLFQRKKTDAFIAKANDMNSQLTSMKMENDRRLSSASGSDLAQQNYNRYLGNTMSNMRVGKQGMKLPSSEEIRHLISPVKLEPISKFQLGGKMNVIVEGALHARKHQLREVNEDLEDVTPKGIPVVVYDEGGEVTQSAEVEESELVLIKELTNKLEKLYKDGSEEAMIEAGKLLTEELMENTDDRTNKLLSDEDQN